MFLCNSLNVQRILTDLRQSVNVWTAVMGVSMVRLAK